MITSLGVERDPDLCEFDLFIVIDFRDQFGIQSAKSSMRQFSFGAVFALVGSGS